MGSMQIIIYFIISIYTLAVFISGAYIGYRVFLLKEDDGIVSPKKPKGLVGKRSFSPNSGPIKAMEKSEAKRKEDDPFKDKFKEIIDDDL